MDFLEHTYTHFPTHHDQLHHDHLSTSIPTYAEAHALHSYAMAHQAAPMMSMPNPVKATETKPRLGKDEVDILEKEFKRNQKPTTQTKRGYAESMGVDLARINNWFQNRRAKRKQEKKQEAFKAAGQAHEVASFSEPSSPDLFQGNAGFFGDNLMPLQHAATFPSALSGPPPAVAPYNPQYENPSNASMESLQRTLAAAQAGQNAARQDFQATDFLEQADALTFVHDASSSHDRAHFPAQEGSVSPFDAGRDYSYSKLSEELQHSPEDACDDTPTPFALSSMPQLMTQFPSQLLPQGHDGQSSHYNDGSSNQSPDGSEQSPFGIEFKYEIRESEESLAVPPPSSLPFRSPPPPMDIASRRKKVHVKPAALIADTLHGRPQLGPRTVSHADGFRRLSDSPMSSPMRRIVSAGGNRSGMSGRIQKPSVESAQRSPINFGGFPDAKAFLERNYQNLRNMPTLTAGSSLNSSLAPPTPHSPREREMGFKSDGSGSSGSPVEGGMNYVFNTAAGFTASVEGDHLASPPETPQIPLNPNTSLPWNHGLPPHGAPAAYESAWFDVPDEPIYTPAQEVFALELQVPPSYLASLPLSQPVTPAFGQFQPNFSLGHCSPHVESEQPLYTLSSQPNPEYAFSDSQSNYALGMFPSPVSKQKTFQFSHSTPADFTEK